MMSRFFMLAQEAAIVPGSAAVEAFFGLGADERFVVLLVAIGCGTGVIIVLSYFAGEVIGTVHRRNAEYELKRDMLDRGMTAEEIAQVIETAAPPEDGVERWITSWGRCKKKSG